MEPASLTSPTLAGKFFTSSATWEAPYLTRLRTSQAGKEPACRCRRLGSHPWVGNIPRGKKWQPAPVFSAREIHGPRSLVGYSPRGHKESDMAKRLETHIPYRNRKEVVRSWSFEVCFVSVRKGWGEIGAHRQQWLAHHQNELLNWRIFLTVVFMVLTLSLLKKEMATHSSILAWRIPWTEEPGGLQSMGSQRVGHDWVILQVILYLNPTVNPTIMFLPKQGDHLYNENRSPICLD